MTIKTKFIINGEKLANVSMYLIVFLICFPLSMVLPSMLRMPLQLLAIGLFSLSLIMLRKYTYLLSLIGFFICSYLYFIASWEEMMEASTFLYNSLCCWTIAIYGALCIKGTIKAEKKLFWLIVILTLITAITTIVGLTQYPLAVRELGRGASYNGTDIKSLYRTRNIASWSQVYGMVFILGGLAYFYKETKNKLVLLTIVITELCILRSQLTFGILLSIVTLALVMINAKSTKYYIIVFISFVVAMVMLINISGILLWAINISETAGLQMLTLKLQDLYNLLVFKAATGDATARIDLYTKSLSAFKEYPFGLFLYRDVQATNYIGYHSEFFDLIGSMGFLGIAIIVASLLAWVHFIKGIPEQYKRRFVIFMLIVFCLIFILNPVFYSPQIWIGVFALPALLTCQEDIELSRHRTFAKVHFRRYN